MPNNNIETRQLDILSSIDRNLDRIATALENIDIKKNNQENDSVKGRTYRDCYGCKHLYSEYDIDTLTNYYRCDYYKTSLNNVNNYCKNKEI